MKVYNNSNNNILNAFRNYSMMMMKNTLKSLFTNVQLKDTIEFILEEIYVRNSLPKVYSKLIFRRLLYKLSTECIFSFTLSDTTAGVHMTKG